MNAQPVDVLAAWDRALAFLEGLDGVYADAISARAAVAELVEAGRELQAAMDEPDGGKFDVGPAKRFHAADARHRVALARMGSQP